MDTVASYCRCGRATPTSHPCHFGGYACDQEGAERIYAKPIGTFSIAGAQPKAVASSTFACDEHWQMFSAALSARDSYQKKYPSGVDQ